MKEIESIISAYEKAQTEGLDCVLATVVHVEGSSYRGAGARMLIDEYGEMTGAISGGCLEGDALKKALLALHQNENKLVTYDTSDESDAVIGAQLGCNGIIQVLFEVIDQENPDNPIELLKKASDAKEDVALISLFNLDRTKHQPGKVLLMDAEGTITGRFSDEKVFNQLKSDAEASLSKKINFFGEYITDETSINVFIEIITPPPHLVLVGAGNDAQVLSEMARLLGWKITVADGRPSHANKNRFSSCQIIVTNPGSILENISIKENTAFVLITHNYNYDLAVLKLLLNEDAVPYIGILGPKKKYQRMLNDLRKDHFELSEEQLHKIFAPVGLQIGAETPAEIGLSVLAEIQAVITKSNVQHLRKIDGSIHKKDNYEFKSVTL